MGIVDKNGLPIAVTTHAANHHEVTLAQLTFDFYKIEAEPEKAIGDKEYDSDGLDEELAQEGIEIIASHPSNRLRKNKTQDGRKLRRYNRRGLIERLFAWPGWQLRLLTRWEYHEQTFSALCSWRPSASC